MIKIDTSNFEQQISNVKRMLSSATSAHDENYVTDVNAGFKVVTNVCGVNEYQIAVSEATRRIGIRYLIRGSGYSKMARGLTWEALNICFERKDEINAIINNLPSKGCSC